MSTLCKVCQYDHHLQSEWEKEGAAFAIIQAHLRDGLLDRINDDRASRDEPAWDSDDLLTAMWESGDLFDG